MREIVLDTETTGLDPYQGHRIVEIGCVELINRIPTGQTYHVYINPERDMPAEAEAVHGLTQQFLADKPLFAEVVEDLIVFLGDAKLVIHNAGFDLAFLNAEFERCKKAALLRERAVDTLTLARRRHPGGPNKLDDLCVRYGIDNSKRTKHGALLDAELLAEVYAELAGGRQARLGLTKDSATVTTNAAAVIRARPAPLAPLLSDAERDAHRAFVAKLGNDALWRKYIEPAEPEVAAK
jgi:DNA polymerase III subunit epsilon